MSIIKLPIKVWICVLLIFIGLGIYTRFIEPIWLETNFVKIKVFEENSKPLRILHLTDLHFSRDVSLEYIAKSIEKGLALKPDIIILTGDYFTYHVSNKIVDSAAHRRFLEMMKRLPKIAPTFACLGNHDGGLWARYSKDNVVYLLNKAGITLLHNQNQQINIKGHTITLIGVGDLWARQVDQVKAFKKISADDPSLKIVIAHNPDTKERIKDRAWTLMLAGHTHGGQLRVPLLGYTPFAPVKDHRYVAGLKKWGQRWIHVSKGIGNIHGVRFNCRPDISIIDLH